ncbi:NAD-dependent epimerase/dehydratase family protein [Streptomyces sioyaensis]|uniref:condensation domain-containing protein n=1 Tax=Streptomyces sioyaensis TaxID=67364 RepID=UPI001F3ABD69|nr:condensation domain-containing protein [Streptomyces sioyaensis]MCF3173464.1 NAD-dependent epimerase/dehydratase family protein [Streptomyces sioyaensis]
MATDSPTAAALQEELLRRARSRTARPAPADEAVHRGPTPLSHAQRRMWLMDRLGRDGGSYSVPFATRLRGPLDPDALAAALTALVGRHEILRTRYGQQDGEPYQEVLPAPEAFTVRVVETDEAGAPALLAEEAHRPFDLAAGPMPRALVLRHGPQDHTVLLTFHHIAIDGPSLETVAAELSVLYTAAAEASAAGLPSPPPQYADFARREQAAADRLAQGLSHWAERLDGASPLPLPRPAQLPADTGARPAGTRTVPLGPQVPAALRALGQEHRATLFTVALAGAFAALHRFTGRDDLVIGVAGTHRQGADMRGLVGLCVNTLPVRVNTAGDPSFTALVARVRDALLDAQQGREVPFDLILERLGATARDADGTPLVRVTADVLGAPTTLQLPGTEGEYIEVGAAEAKFDLSFGLVDGAEPAGLVQYSRTALDEEAAAALGGHYAALLTAVAADPGLRLSRLPGEPPARRGEAGGHPAEALLRAHPEVAEAVVVEPAGGPLLAYAVLREIGGPAPAVLRSHLRAALARDLVPAAVTLLDVMPRTAAGTVEVSRLPGMPSAPAPEGERAEAVTEGFAALLGHAPGPDDDFFLLGGHSLIAVQLAERLRQALKLPLTGLDILQARTPRAVTALLDAREAERAAAPTAAPSRPRRAREGTVLVTGGTGGVGAFVLRELAAQGRPVLALARPESAHLVAAQGVDVIEGDLTDLDGLRKAVDSADAVIHAACTFTRPEVDVTAMAAMIGAWSRGPFVFVSSVDAYGHPEGEWVAEESAPRGPLSGYGQAKADCEGLLLRAAGAEGRGGASAVRSPLVWGAHQRLRDQLRWGATGLLYQAAREGRPIALPRPGTGGHAWYGAAWVHAAALARAVVSCLDAPVHGVANAVSGHLAWRDLATELTALLGSDSEIRDTDEVHPDLDHRWHYHAARLAPSLVAQPGEDWRAVLAAMVGPEED